MSELWIPQPSKLPDITNIFDLMLVFQEQLDFEKESATKMLLAKTAVMSLARHVKELHVTERSISLVTDTAIVDTEPELTNGQRVDTIGIVGIMQDVHGISIGESLPLSISLDINVLRTFSVIDPDDQSYNLQTAITPISRVHYIERLAS